MFNLSETAKISCHYESFTTVEPSLGKRTELICTQYFTALHEKSGNFGRERYGVKLREYDSFSPPPFSPAKGRTTLTFDSYLSPLCIRNIRFSSSVLIRPFSPAKRRRLRRRMNCALKQEEGGVKIVGESRASLKQGGDERIEDESYLKLVGGLSGSWPWQHMSRSRLSELAPLIIIMIKLSLFL